MSELAVPTEAADRAPSFDVSSERVVLGCLMLQPSGVDELGGLLAADDFYNPRHGEVFAAILVMHSQGHPTEPTALTAFLADQGRLAHLGGAPFLHECVASVPTASNLSFYANRVAELAEARQWEANAVRIAQAVSAPGRDLASVADLAADLISKARPRREQLELTELGSLINPALDDIETRAQRKVGIRTGFKDLDKMLGGLRPKQLITVAGATGMGKSITLVDFARNIAIKQGLTVAFFTLEMSNQEVFERILSSESGVLHYHIRDGELDERDWQKITKNLGPMSNAPFFLSDRAPRTVRSIKQACENLRRVRGQLDVVFVDHMHLVRPSSAKIVDERAIIEDVSRDLKQELAMDLDVPVVAAAQMNRNVSTRMDKTPQLSDLKNSSSIEQHSNFVILVHRPEYYDRDSPRKGEADFVVDKNRTGDKGIVTVASQLHLSRFVDMAIV